MRKEDNLSYLTDEQRRQAEIIGQINCQELLSRATRFVEFENENTRCFAYVEMVNQLLWPYLTEKGQQIYTTISFEIKRLC